eukprot:jgi/Ulvmu1/235/UM001_0239.1
MAMLVKTVVGCLLFEAVTAYPNYFYDRSTFSCDQALQPLKKHGRHASLWWDTTVKIILSEVGDESATPVQAWEEGTQYNLTIIGEAPVAAAVATTSGVLSAPDDAEVKCEGKAWASKPEAATRHSLLWQSPKCCEMQDNIVQIVTTVASCKTAHFRQTESFLTSACSEACKTGYDHKPETIAMAEPVRYEDECPAHSEGHEGGSEAHHEGDEGHEGEEGHEEPHVEGHEGEGEHDHGPEHVPHSHGGAPPHHHSEGNTPHSHEGDEGDEGGEGAVAGDADEGDEGDEGADVDDADEGDEGDEGAVTAEADEGDEGDEGATVADADEGDEGNEGTVAADVDEGDEGATVAAVPAGDAAALAEAEAQAGSGDMVAAAAEEADTADETQNKAARSFGVFVLVSISAAIAGGIVVVVLRRRRIRRQYQDFGTLEMRGYNQWGSEAGL